MAYLARIEPAEFQPPALSPTFGESVSEPEFSDLEWSVIRLARGDRLSTLRSPGPLGRFYHWLVGRTGSPQLANPKLEALRRISVLSWHFGYSVSGDDVADFLAAGFTPEQYDLLVSSVRAAASSHAQRFSEAQA